MKKRFAAIAVTVLVLTGLVCALGIGPFTSSSAARDLREELASIHGEPYTGRVVENGTETMEFTVEPDSYFLTNWSFRNFLGWDYRYTCTVTYTVSSGDNIVSVRRVTYRGVDPMGSDEELQKAHLVPESMQEQKLRS